jgi:hypothetical protein
MPLLWGIPTYMESAFDAQTFFPRAREVGATAAVAVGSMGAAIARTEPSEVDLDHNVNRMMCAPRPRGSTP